MAKLNGTTKGALITVGVVAFSGLFGWVLRNTDVLSDVKVESAIVSQQAKGIKMDPLFFDLSAAEMGNPNSGKGHRLARWGCSHKFAFVRTVQDASHHHFISLDNQVFFF